MKPNVPKLDRHCTFSEIAFPSPAQHSYWITYLIKKFLGVGVVFESPLLCVPQLLYFRSSDEYDSDPVFDSDVFVVVMPVVVGHRITIARRFKFLVNEMSHCTLVEWWLLLRYSDGTCCIHFRRSYRTYNNCSFHWDVTAVMMMMMMMVLKGY